jgi:hypothetical protein
VENKEFVRAHQGTHIRLKFIRLFETDVRGTRLSTPQISVPDAFIALNIHTLQEDAAGAGSSTSVGPSLPPIP